MTQRLIVDYPLPIDMAEAFRANIDQALRGQMSQSTINVGHNKIHIIFVNGAPELFLKKEPVPEPKKSVLEIAKS
jgi:hypothetical protein